MDKAFRPPYLNGLLISLQSKISHLTGTGAALMDLATLQLPVFLPGSNRNWEEVKGVARFTAEGEVVVKLQPEDAGRLIAMARRGILVQLAFDYRVPAETLEVINTQYQKED